MERAGELLLHRAKACFEAAQGQARGAFGIDRDVVAEERCREDHVAELVLEVLALFLAGTRGLGTVRPLVLNDQVAKPVLRLFGVVGVLLAGGGPEMVEAVAGMVDDEDPADAALREADEEAGLRLGELADRVGTDKLREATAAVLDYAERRTRSCLEELEDGEREAVEGRRAAADLVHQDERVLGRCVDDRRRLGHLDHEGRLRVGEVVGGAGDKIRTRRRPYELGPST